MIPIRKSRSVSVLEKGTRSPSAFTGVNATSADASRAGKAICISVAAIGPACRNGGMYTLAMSRTIASNCLGKRLEEKQSLHRDAYYWRGLRHCTGSGEGGNRRFLRSQEAAAASRSQEFA